MNALQKWNEMSDAQRMADWFKLREALEKSKRSHDSCDDCWYSCPLSEEGCCDDRWPKDECNCGASKFNAEIDALLATVSESEQ